MRFRISIFFTAASQEEAREYLRAFTKASINVMPRTAAVGVALANLARRQMVMACLKWGGLIGVLFAAYALYCIATGFWR